MDTLTCRHCGYPIGSLLHRCRGEVVGATGGRGFWRGRVRLPSGEILFQCEDGHKNRDQGSAYWGPAALSCAYVWLRNDQLGLSNERTGKVPA